MTFLRLLGLLAIVVGGVYAWRGGQYSMTGYRALERQEASYRARKVLLRHQVDSLQAFLDSLQHDPAVQQRVAREQWGMLRPGELAFQVEPSDSAATPPGGERK